MSYKPNKKTYYIYDENGLYKNSQIVYDNIREQRVFVAPISSTDLKPPEVTQNEVAVFEKNVWKIVADYRNFQGFDKETQKKVIITELGITPDSLNLTIQEPPTGDYCMWDETSESWTEDTESKQKAEVTEQERLKQLELSQKQENAGKALRDTDYHYCNDVWEKKTSEEQEAITKYRENLRNYIVLADFTKTLPTKPSFLL